MMNAELPLPLDLDCACVIGTGSGVVHHSLFIIHHLELGVAPLAQLASNSLG